MDKILAKYGNQLKDNKELILTIVKNYDKALAYANDTILNDEHFILKAVTLNGASLQYATDSLKNNEVIALAAVKRNGKALKYASDSLKNNKTVVLAAVKSKGSALRYASLNLQNNRNIVFEAVKKNCNVAYIPNNFLKEDEEIVTTILNRQNITTYSLAMSNEVLRNNRQLVLKAISKKGLDLEFASSNLQNDIEVLQTAVYENFSAFNYTHLSFSEIKNLVLDALKNWNFNWYYKVRKSTLNLSKYNVIAAIKFNLNNWYSVDQVYKNDKELMLFAIGLNASSYYYASEELKLDRDIVLARIKIDDYRYDSIYDYIKQICYNFKEDEEVLTCLSSKTGLDLEILKKYDEYSNAKTLLGKWFYKLDTDTLSALSECTTLFYPGAGYDFSTIQFFMENSNVKNFYYSDYMNLDINSETVLTELINWFYNWDYKIIRHSEIYPIFFNENNWDNFWYPSEEARFGSNLELSFITKYIIEKEGKTWNLYYFGTEAIATFKVLLKNIICIDILVTQDHGLGGCWTSFCHDSLLEKIAKEYNMLPEIILSGGEPWNDYQETSDWFGKFGMHKAQRKLWKRSEK